MKKKKCVVYNTLTLCICGFTIYCLKTVGWDIPITKISIRYFTL